VFEGRSRYTRGEAAPGHVDPVIVQSHRRGSCAIIAGFVVRDRSLPLYGRYLFGDLCRDRLSSAQLTAGGARGLTRTALRVGSLTSFGEDALGRIYTTSLRGPVHRISAGA
jgi:hypothetical protein